MNFFEKIMQGLSGTAAQELPQNAILIDVRSEGEFASGYIDGAISLPLASITQTIGQAVPDKATALLLYCQSGARSAAARNSLLQMGYQQVVNGGGIGALAMKLQKQIRRT